MEKDILNIRSAELKKMPYDVPEGYFETFRKDVLSRTCVTVEKPGTFRRLAPYISMAATFLLIVATGTLVIGTASSDEMTYEDYMVHSDMLISAIYEPEQLADAGAEVGEEDIIEYLIYTGTSPEDIETYK